MFDFAFSYALDLIDELDLDAPLDFPIRPNAVQRATNRFSMALAETHPAPCSILVCPYGDPNHGDGYCTVHADFCDERKTGLLWGPGRYVEDRCR